MGEYFLVGQSVVRRRKKRTENGMRSSAGKMFCKAGKRGSRRGTGQSASRCFYTGRWRHPRRIINKKC